MSSVLKCRFCEPVTDSFNILRSYLPEDYEYLVCNLNTNSTNFKARLRTSGKNEDYAHKWLEDFQMHSKCTMRVERTYPHSGTKNVFKVDLRCQHNTKPRSEKVREKESCKNTDCPAKMTITIKRVVTERKSRSKDPHLPDYPTVIQINFCHNHDILAPEILKHRSVLPEVREKLLSLFWLGHNPSTALDMHRYDLLLQYGENFDKVAPDRALLPDSQFCYRLYYRMTRKEAKSENTTESGESLAVASPPKKSSLSTPLSNCENSSVVNNSSTNDTIVVPLNGERKTAKKKRKLESVAMFDKREMSKQISAEMYKFCKTGGIAGMLQVDDNNSVMALCTPLMLRVHSFLKYSGEVVFIDSYGELDGEPGSCRLYLLVTYSCAGGPLPLGCLVSTSTTAPVVRAALDLWKQILQGSTQGTMFFGKGEDGPDIFCTNDIEAEKQAIRSSFPKSQVLVCTSHILQATWAFLIDRKNAIKKEHRSPLLSILKALLFSQTAEELELNYAYAMGDTLVKSNTLFLDYLNHVYNHKHDWSLVYCRHLLQHRADDLSIFWQSAMVVLKDPILSRARTFNQLQILDFLSRLDTHYERKLIDLVNGRLDSVRLSRFLLVDLPREAYTITQYSEIEYEVHNDNKDTTYQVDVSLGVCECRTGKNGAPCKHQLLVFRNFSVPLYDCVPPNTPVENNLFFLLATGHSIVGESSDSDVSKTQCRTQSTPDAAISKPSMGTNATTEIVIHDLEICSENFFLDDSNSPLVQPQQQPTPQEDFDGDGGGLMLPQLEDDRPMLEDIPDSETSSVSDIVSRICSELKQRTSRSPATFRPALTTFLKNLERTASDSSLEHALYSFGKFSKSATPLFRRKVADDKLIGLQSTGEIPKSKKSPFRSKT